MIICNGDYCEIPIAAEDILSVLIAGWSMLDKLKNSWYGDFVDNLKSSQHTRFMDEELGRLNAYFWNSELSFISTS